MKKTIYRRILGFLIVCNVITLLIFGYRLFRQNVPNEMKLLVGQEEQINISLPLYASISEDAIGVLYVNQKPISKDSINVNLSKLNSVCSNETGNYHVKISLFGWIPLKEISLKIIEELEVIPSGKVVGLQIATDGILVLGTGEVFGADGNYHEPAKGLIKSGDYIIAVDGQTVKKKEDLMERIGADEISLTIDRGGRRRIIQLQPVKDHSGDYKLGVWIRTDTQGIGTLTFTTSNGYFGALGHGITDVDTGVLMRVGSGTLYEAEVLSIVQGREGSPGELIGMIRRSSAAKIGNIQRNTVHGIFGQTKIGYTSDYGKMAIGLKQSITVGPAKILCQVDHKVREYEIEIIRINLGDANGSKGIVLRITDKDLLKKTGGIVQGMSGSPIIQDGKIIGAVTHVFVNDPTRGYGIFIEEMLEN